MIIDKSNYTVSIHWFRTNLRRLRNTWPAPLCDILIVQCVSICIENVMYVNTPFESCFDIRNWCR